MNAKKSTDIDAYIAGFPADIQKVLQQVRTTIRKAAPNAEETIKYDMPTFTYNGNLVYFAAFKKHIGFYAVPTGDKTFKKEFAAYKTGKGSIQFPLDKPMPLKLITKIVKYRVRENRGRSQALRSGSV